MLSIAQEGYHIGKIQSYGNGKKCVLKKARWGRQKTTLFLVLFHYEYFKIYIAFVFQEIQSSLYSASSSFYSCDKADFRVPAPKR